MANLNKKAYKEKRKYIRKKCSATVGYAAYLDTNHTAVIKDISQGGAFVKTNSLPDVGQNILMTIQFPDEPKPITIIGEVAWHSAAGMGVKFKLGLHAALIASYVDDA